MGVLLIATGAYLPGELATAVRDLMRGPAVLTRVENALRK
jgi:hypothetical protein